MTCIFNPLGTFKARKLSFGSILHELMESVFSPASRQSEWQVQSLLHKLLNVIPAYMRSKTRSSTFFELTFLSNDKYRQMLPIPLDRSVEQQT